MSNEGLKSEVRRLESQLRDVESYNRELNQELAVIINGVSRAYNTLENYNTHMQNTLQNSNNVMRSSHQNVIAAYELQGEIERLYVRFKNIELANKKIRAANNKKYYDFANYRTVRKIVQGIMDNIEKNMVSDQTIFKAVEIQHLQIPDYWLTCALISIMAWKNDDKELAERAMSRAILIDKKHSAIFYMLFNLRVNRNEAALKWFVVYQECEQTGSDQRTFLMLFSLISKTIQETVDENLSAQISGYINSMIISGSQAEGYDEEDIISQICYKYARMKSSEELEYTLLRKYCASFSEFSENMMRAKNNINILEYILKIINVPEEQKNAFLKDYIDELISIPNQAEESVHEEIAYNELIIKLEGDIETAKSRFAAEQERAKTQINIISEIIGWIFERDNQEINGQMRLNMFTLIKDLQEKSIEKYTEDYRGRKKTAAPVKINDYSATVDFTREHDEIRKIDIYYTGIKNNLLSSIKNWKAFIGFIIAAVVLIGGIIGGVYASAAAITVVGIIAALICAGAGFFTILGNKSKRKQYEMTCSDNIRIATDTLQKIFNEFREYQTQFDEYDAYHDKIINELNKI